MHMANGTVYISQSLHNMHVIQKIWCVNYADRERNVHTCPLHNYVHVPVSSHGGVVSLDTGCAVYHRLAEERTLPPPSSLSPPHSRHLHQALGGHTHTHTHTHTHKSYIGCRHNLNTNQWSLKQVWWWCLLAPVAVSMCTAVYSHCDSPTEGEREWEWGACSE